ncbi:MAG: HDIG domain-containing protein [Phycisphaerales bacterium]|nr:HDIG domain-containing protein [Phycisphaerales bacterium]MCB9836134.1 HDIG domain-containing protein [Phycisphaera sp.]
MAKDTTKSTGRGGRAKRKLAVKRETLTVTSLLRRASSTPELGWGALIVVAFTVFSAWMVWWAGTEPMVAAGDTARRTVLTRVPVQLLDEDATTRAREQARLREPRVYTPDEPLIAEVLTSLESLPTIIAPTENVEQVDNDIRRTFAIGTEAYAELKKRADANGVPTDAWRSRMESLRRQLERRPILDAETYRRERESLGDNIQLAFPSARRSVLSVGVVNGNDPAMLKQAGRDMATQAGIAQALIQVVEARIGALQNPTFRFDQQATSELQESAAARVTAVVNDHPAGAVVLRAGEKVTATQLELFRKEAQTYAQVGPLAAILVNKGAQVLGCLAIALGAAGYAALYCPRIRRNPQRMLGVAAILLGAQAVTVFGTAAAPELRGVTVLAPTIFATVILLIAYDPRVALALGTLMSVLVCHSINEPVATLAALLAGIGVAAWQLYEIRDRRTLIRAGFTIGSTLAAATAVASTVGRPGANTIAPERVLQESLTAGAGGVLVMGITLFILPTIERLFQITTGMTLIELRDPKQRLLRELQQRAPGTYNHSLNVASIAETAADAIGADALLTYVGALYHDVGKMNKPEYFVENQTGGPSKHDKLSPAMSLLVIVGHVKDGLEMAREFGLPRKLHAFIEGHHGTTLVEYFYDRAKKQAKSKAEDSGETRAELPEEIEYRYPGPKPKTKEVAILMIADAIESATRSMSEPTPSRIESLVHTIAKKRLEDGQFDECGLTLKDLHTIEESVAKSVTAIYHGRISYPGSGTGTSGR